MFPDTRPPCSLLFATFVLDESDTCKVRWWWFLFFADGEVRIVVGVCGFGKIFVGCWLHDAALTGSHGEQNVYGEVKCCCCCYHWGQAPVALLVWRVATCDLVVGGRNQSNSSSSHRSFPVTCSGLFLYFCRSCLRAMKSST